MRPSVHPHLVLIVEGQRDDELLTLRALARTGLSMRIEVERDGERALFRYRDEFASLPPRLVVVSDGLSKRGAHEVASGVRLIHPSDMVAILHLLSTEAHAPAPDADDWLVKPMDYGEYMDAVGSAVRRWLTD